ncbi:MAG: hypothetical protein RL228_360 [Actinomycetota bacterium]
MSDVQLNPIQKRVIPYIAALVASLVGLIGVLTPWISISGSGISSSGSTQSKLTFFVVVALLLLGLSAFVEQLQRFRKLIALISALICAEVLVSYGIWLYNVLKAIKGFNDSVEKLDDTGGIFGEALANLTKNIKPSITTGFYMVLAATFAGLIIALVVYLENSAENSVIEMSKIQMISISVLATLTLVAIVALSGNSKLDESLNSASGGLSTSSDSSQKSESAKVFDCLDVANTGNAIKLNQPSFSGDPDPTDIFVATKLRMTNNCGKAIEGVKGTVNFMNVVGDTIFTGGFTDDNTILPEASISTSLNTGWTFNQFEDEYGVLQSTDQTKAKAVLIVSKIVFADGTSLSE